jgi:hypothetical protein
VANWQANPKRRETQEKEAKEMNTISKLTEGRREELLSAHRCTVSKSPPPTFLKELVNFYWTAKEYLSSRSPYKEEVELVTNRRFEEQTMGSFLHQYIFVVLNTGLKSQAADKIMARFIASHYDLNIIGHSGKRKAIREALASYDNWFLSLKAVDDKLAFLETLPFIGPITKFHLARNLGFDVAKPDRHLTRLAARFGFASVSDMCQAIHQETNERIGLIDVILWRISNLGFTPNVSEEGI